MSKNTPPDLPVAMRAEEGKGAHAWLDQNGTDVTMMNSMHPTNQGWIRRVSGVSMIDYFAA